MPNWQPNWKDVRWNWGAAQEASNELRRMADLLERTADERERLAGKATWMWRGRFRFEFDQDLVRLLSEARQLAAQCREIAVHIDTASQWAQEEQHRRVAARERWRQELENERRASQTST